MSKVLDYTRKATWALGVSKKYINIILLLTFYNYIFNIIIQS